jgi:hypothetical protein
VITRGHRAVSPRRLGGGGEDRRSAGPHLPHLAHAYGVSLLILVNQLVSETRVPPQLPIGALTYWANVHVWPMYSEAIQMSLPSVHAAP